MTTVMMASGRTLDDVFEAIEKALSEDKASRADVKDRDDGLIGLDIDPRKAKPRELEPVLLTLRRDLTSAREKLLGGAGRKTLLRELDYTIDRLDNLLGEM